MSKKSESIRANTENRYQTQNNLECFGTKTQQFLSDAHVALIGLGGIGSNALALLAGAGIGRLSLIDHDRVELSNLHRQTIYRESDVGQLKAVAAASYAAARNSNIETVASPVRLDPQNFAQVLHNADLVIDGADDQTLSLQLNQWALVEQKNILFANAIQQSGQLFFLAGGNRDESDNKACFNCLWHKQGHFAAQECSAQGVLGSVPAAIGVAAADSALRFFINSKAFIKTASVLIHYDYEFQRIHKIGVEKLPDCPACTALKHSISSHKTVRRFATISDAIKNGFQIIDLCSDDERKEHPLCLEGSKGKKNAKHTDSSMELQEKICFVCLTGKRAKHKAFSENLLNNIKIERGEQPSLSGGASDSAIVIGYVEP